MTQSRLISSIAFVIVLMLCGCAGGGTTGSGGTSVRGTVVDQQNQPIAGVLVTVFDPSGQALATSTSGSDGSFDFSQVSSDSGSVRFESADGSELATTDYMVPSNSSGVVVIVTRKPNGESETEVSYEIKHNGNSNGEGSGNSGGGSGDSSDDDGSNDQSDHNSGPGHDSFDDNSGDNSDSGDMTSPPSQGSDDDDNSGHGSSGHGGVEDHSGDDSGGNDDSGDDSSGSGKGR